MGMMLSMLEGMAGMTDQEKAVVEQATPTLIDVLKTVQAELPELTALNDMYVQGQPLIKRLLDDLKVLAPNGIALLSDGMVDIAGSTSTVTDLQNLYKQNPGWVKAIHDHYNRLVPVINKLTAEWPKVEPAVNAVSAAMARKQMHFGEALQGVHDSMLDGSFSEMEKEHRKNLAATEEVQPQPEPDEDFVETEEEPVDISMPMDDDTADAPRPTTAHRKTKRRR